MKIDIKTEPIVIKGDISNEELLEILKKPTKKKFFCFHNWVYWKFKHSTRHRRVCVKCYKKQQDRYVINQGRARYIKDVKFN